MILLSKKIKYFVFFKIPSFKINNTLGGSCPHLWVCNPPTRKRPKFFLDERPLYEHCEPYFNSAYVVRVPIFLSRLYHLKFDGWKLFSPSSLNHLSLNIFFHNCSFYSTTDFTFLVFFKFWPPWAKIKLHTSLESADMCY